MSFKLFGYNIRNPFFKNPKSLPSHVKNKKIYIKNKKKRSIPKAVKVAVWNEYVGQHKGETKCFVGCGTTITSLNFAAGHIQSEANGGAITVQNLRPICTSCNSSMGTTNMKEFANKYGMNHKLGWF